ncbi:MAG: hypothetical protein AAF961_05730 [Planctomycetota bacterium]
MPAICDALGVTFEYPDNWTVEAPEPDDEGVQVAVSGPETAFWHLSRHDAGADFESLFDEALAALRADYHEIEATSVAEVIEGRRIEGFDVNFYCLDLTVTTWLRGIPTDAGSFLLLCQAEDRDLERVGPVFQAMLASLLRRI